MCSVCVGDGLVSCWKSLIWTGCVYWYVFPGISVTSAFFAFEVGEKGWKRGLYIGINMFALFFQGISKFEVLTSFEGGEKFIQCDSSRLKENPKRSNFSLFQVGWSAKFFQNRCVSVKFPQKPWWFRGQKSWFHLVYLGSLPPPNPAVIVTSIQVFCWRFPDSPQKNCDFNVTTWWWRDNVCVCILRGVRSKV